ncbi:MAG: PTS lactose/cellobiose transporter subunit IIA [Erysipelotrichaceae bacterium]|nr:PTS lactose/cellobiose transporter subunit IIA [Clostridia bacterium]MBQ6216940.1 PTS lactose/cellobiose transporter subunit IIA [Erysipelotrichaceae bacterium]
MSEHKSEYDFPTISMNIIMPAGNARTAAINSMDALMAGDVEKCEEELKKAKQFVKEAHKAQTDVLQSLAARDYEGNKEPVVLPMLFVHAQDTIMTIMSEVHLIEKMEEMYKKLTEEK